MGIIQKQSIANAIITYTGIALGFLLTVFLYPHILNPDQYGLTRVLISASLISAQFAHLGVRNAVIKFFPFFSDGKGKRRGLLFWTIVIPLAGFLLFSVLYLLFDDLIIKYYAEQSPLFVDYYLWILPITFFILYFEVLNSYLRSLLDSVSGPIVNEVLQRILVISFLALYFFDFIRFSHFILLFTIAYGVQPVILAWRIYKMGEFRLIPDFNILRKPVIKGVSNYSLYSLLGGLTTVLVWNVDIMMLGSMSGLADTAIYAIAFYIGSVITVPQRSIEKIATPLVSDFIQKKDWEQVLDIYRKTSLNQTLGGIFILGLIWINIDLLLSFLPEPYAAGKWVVVIVGIGKLIDMSTGVNSSILINSRYYRVSFYANLVLVFLTILMNYLLIPRYGINGAAIATALSITLYSFVKVIFVWVKLELQPFTKKTSVLLITGAAAILISFIPELVTDHFLILFLSENLLFTVIFLTPILWLKTSPELNNLVVNFLSRPCSSH